MRVINTVKSAIVLTLLSFALSAPAAAELKLTKAVGDWSIYREVDAMTDRLICAAFYKGDSNLQLSINSLAIAYKGRGGIQAYQYRLDDNPASEYTRATGDERGMDIIFFRDEVLERIQSAKRIRIQGYTLVRGTVVDDIDLTDAAGAIREMRAMGCQ